MYSVFLIIICLLMGLVFGFILAKIVNSILNYFLRKKVEKEAKENPKPFFYQTTPYNLKEQIEYEQSKKKKKKLSLFKKKVKGGISDYGNTEQPRSNERTREESVLGNSGSVGITTIPNNPTSPETAREQRSPDSAKRTTELGRSFNRNLFEKRK